MSSKLNSSTPMQFSILRFSSISVRICNLNPEVALHSMLMALKQGLFSNNMDDLRTSAFGYIQMEEMTKFCNSICSGQALASRNHKDHNTLVERMERRARARGRIESHCIRSSPGPSPNVCEKRVNSEHLVKNKISTIRGGVRDEEEDKDGFDGSTHQ
ncbi:hypothetical protein CR513_28654, partial [Mucuna pruriens]